MSIDLVSSEATIMITPRKFGDTSDPVISQISSCNHARSELATVFRAIRFEATIVILGAPQKLREVGYGGNTRVLLGLALIVNTI